MIRDDGGSKQLRNMGQLNVVVLYPRRLPSQLNQYCSRCISRIHLSCVFYLYGGGGELVGSKI
jgi:hypothetical protein